MSKSLIDKLKGKSSCVKGESKKPIRGLLDRGSQLWDEFPDKKEGKGK